jgi:F-type H+-transporting ATPase subunit b
MLVASNPLIQVTPGLMIWTIVCFLIALFVLKRYAFGPIQTAIDKRRDQIAQSIAEADDARAEARELLEQHRALIGQAKSESAEILADARKVGDAQLARVKDEAEADRVRRLEETRKQIEAETSRALDQIRTEVADLTVDATQRVVGKVLNTDDHRRLVDEAIADLDFSALERGRN